MKRHYMVVDLGTGNSRVILVTSEGEILGVRTFTNTYYRDEAYEDAQYILPHEWWEKIRNGAAELAAEFPDITIDAVTSAGTRQSFVLYDQEGDAFLGLPNIDNRGRAYVKDLPNKQEMYRISGKWVTEDAGAAKMLGLRKVYPETYARMATFTSISEWIGEILTGNIVIEPSMACESQLYDIHEQDWSDVLCDYYGIDKQVLPKLAMAGEVVGDILPEYKEMFHMAEDAVFLVGGADTQTALMQTGMEIGDIGLVSGTTTPVVTWTEEAIYDPGQRIWVDAGLGGQICQIETNPGATGLNYQRAKVLLLPDWEYDRLEAAYEAKTSFGCTASFASLLFHEQRSLRHGGFFMRSALDPAVDRVDMLWAVLADIACSTVEQLQSLRLVTGKDKPYLWGCGGGFQSRTLCQMIADLSGRELRLYPGFEQATTQGLVNICNNAFGEASLKKADSWICYHPRKDQLIHRHQPEWKRNRDQANQKQE
ncbi:MAG: carbohydrate kinase [Lachnospiraceae bacterium]|nr:carbohydrate kinase [Lachnospiraceae bacterium]